MRTIAIDWSGARRGGGARTTWIAEAIAGDLVRLESGRTPDEVVAWLVAQRARGGAGVVGLDFAFALPAWYGHASGEALWATMARDAEALLARCAPPFWGRPGRPRPHEPARGFRRCEDLVVGGIRPKSAFQIGGAGAVGTGSLRGMTALHALRAAGFAVWPFTPAASWTLVEIYPRLLTGPVNKSSAAARRAHLARRVRGPLLDCASSTEDAFDAAVSALVMAAHVDELARLPPGDPVEGAIWAPRAAAPHAAPSSALVQVHDVDRR